MGFSKKCATGFVGFSFVLSLVSCSSTQKHASLTEVPADEIYNRLPAAECDKSKYKECKQARKNDTADVYMLAHNGTLFRRINGATCAVTSGVSDFKISQHPSDLAVIYYVKDENLFMVNLDKEQRRKGECPSASGNTKMLMSNVEKYTVTSSTDSTIVNAALSRSGSLKAWDNTNVVYSDEGIVEFSMNTCFGSKGKSFSSYVLFTRDTYDNITKVKVENGSRFVKNSSKTSGQRFSRISEFKKHENVCK